MTPSSPALDPSALPPPLRARLAAGRHDYHRVDADLAGIPPAHLGRWVRAGFLEPLGRGDYVIDAPLVGDDRFAKARCAHLRRCESLLRGTPGLYLVGASSLVAHGVPVLAVPRRVEVSQRPRHRSARSCLTTRMPWGSAPTVASGLRCQPAGEAVVEVAALDGVGAGLISADALLHAGKRREALVEACAEYGNRRGARAARLVAEHADPRIESPGESLLRWIAHRHGVALIPQVELRDERGRFVARVDFVIAGTDVVVEFDGLGKYRTDVDLQREKLRQLAIERLGRRVVRFTFRDLDDEVRLMATLHLATAAAA